MPKTTFKNRRAVRLENDDLRVSVLEEGGHIAEIFDKRTGVSPLWIPPWHSIEHSEYDAAKHPEYGEGSEAKLLAGIMGHNLCLDIFGGPSAEETAAGVTVHGEASTVKYEIHEEGNTVEMRAHFPLAQINFARRIELRGRAVLIAESVENLTAWDRPIGWTQHVTLGPPFLEKGVTELRASMTRSKVIELHLNDDMQMKPATEFEWPHAPRTTGGTADLCTFTNAAKSSEFSTHLADPTREHVNFVAFHPKYKLAFGYVWKREEFPWLGMWQENMSRTHAPWSSRTLTLGLEFGVSPMPESRRAMVERGSLFGVPAFKWLPAKGTLHAEYCIVAQNAMAIPDALEWPS
jgi:hypothetical protein